MVVLAEHHRVDPGVPRGLDYRVARLAGRPHELGVDPRRLDLVAGLSELGHQLRRRCDGLAFPVGDVVEGAEEAVDLRIERHLEDREHDETGVAPTGLVDPARERPAGRRRVVEADEHPAHAAESTSGRVGDALD